MKITDFLKPLKHRYIFLIGGGGKTTLLFFLAHHLILKGFSVITTTSTKIRRPASDQSSQTIIGADLSTLIPEIQSALDSFGHITLGKRSLPENKISGFSAPELDFLQEQRVADFILVEADGSKGRSLKAHKDTEPVISRKGDLVIPVIGVDCLGKPLEEKWVHRPELFSKRLPKEMGTPITAEDIGNIFFHPQGYLREVAPEADIIVFISKVKTEEDRRKAEGLDSILKEMDRDERVKGVVMGNLIN